MLESKRTYNKSSENSVETEQHLVTEQPFVSMHTHNGSNNQVVFCKTIWSKIYDWKMIIATINNNWCGAYSTDGLVYDR